jgi:cell division inhibitor SulA
MKRLLLNSLVISTLMATSLLGCDRGAKDRVLKDPAKVLEEKAKEAEKLKAAEAAKAAEEAKKKAAANAGKGADPAAPSVAGGADGKTIQKPGEGDKGAKNPPPGQNPPKPGDKPGAGPAVPPGPDGKDRKDDPPKDDPKEDQKPVTDLEKAKAALEESQSTAKASDLKDFSSAIQTAASSLVFLHIPNPTSGSKRASELAKELNMPEKEKTPLAGIISYISQGERPNKYLILTELQNCEKNKIKASDCPIYEKSYIKLGFVSSPSQADATIITTTAAFLDGYFKTMVPKGTVTSADAFKSLLAAEVQVVMTRFIPTSNKDETYLSDGGASGNASGLSLISVSDEALAYIVTGKYSESALHPSKNLVTLKLSKKANLTPITLAKGACSDKILTSQSSNIASYEPKVEAAAIGSSQAKPGKNIVATVMTTPSSPEAIKKLAEGKIPFAIDPTSPNPEKNLIISTATVNQGLSGSPILNDQGEYYGIVSAVGGEKKPGNFAVFGACLDDYAVSTPATATPPPAPIAATTPAAVDPAPKAAEPAGTPAAPAARTADTPLAAAAPAKPAKTTPAKPSKPAGNITKKPAANPAPKPEPKK